MQFYKLGIKLNRTNGEIQWKSNLTDQYLSKQWNGEQESNATVNRTEVSGKETKGKMFWLWQWKRLNESAIEKAAAAAEIEMRKWQAQERCTNDEMKECEGIELNMGNMNHFQSNSQNS